MASDDEEDVSSTPRGELSEYILSVSAGMVGVCITVIGLFRIVSRSAHVDSVADNLLAIDALVFLGSCFLSYLALRARTRRRAKRFERAADYLFLAGLAMVSVVGVLIAYELI
jgi:threonine/homoserine/homoserine lactone efflux protein